MARNGKNKFWKDIRVLLVKSMMKKQARGCDDTIVNTARKIRIDLGWMKDTKKRYKI